MKILVVIHEFPPIGGGGGLIARDLALELAKRGHQLRIVTAAFTDLPASEIRDGLEIIRLTSGRKESFRAGFGTMASFMLAVNRYLLFGMKDFTPDVIHVHFAVPGGPAAWLYSKLKRIPYLITIHLGDIPGASPEKTGKWFRFVYPLSHYIWNQAKKIVAVSNYSKNLAQKSYAVPIEVIPNGIDTQLFRPEKPEAHDPVEIVFAGRLVPQKNVSQIIRVCSEIQERPWRCTLIGDGQEREQLEKKIWDADLENKISITGWLSPEQVTERFCRSDILFLPSRNEGLPIVGIQAMASGLALLLSTAGGSPELIENEGENGFICDPEDTAGFVNRLRQMIGSPAMLTRMKQNSLERAKQYDIRRIGALYEEAFFSCLKKE